MQLWEYQVIEVPADAVDRMAQALNEAGRHGWEAVSSWGMKKGIGRDTAAVVMKRPSHPPPPPPG